MNGGTYAAPSSYRGMAKRAVQQWAIELEAAMAGSSTHPLVQVRELHLTGTGAGGMPTRRPVTIKDENGERTIYLPSITATGIATRSSGRSKPPIDLAGRSSSEIHRIMRHVAEVDMRYWRVLCAWGLGWTLADQAEAQGASKATIAKQFEGGLAVVQSCLLARWFARK